MTIIDSPNHVSNTLIIINNKNQNFSQPSTNNSKTKIFESICGFLSLTNQLHVDLTSRQSKNMPQKRFPQANDKVPKYKTSKTSSIPTRKRNKVLSLLLQQARKNYQITQESLVVILQASFPRKALLNLQRCLISKPPIKFWQTTNIPSYRSILKNTNRPVHKKVPNMELFIEMCKAEDHR